MNTFVQTNRILTIFDILDKIDSIPDFDLAHERIDFLHKIDAIEYGGKDATALVDTYDDEEEEMEEEEEEDSDNISDVDISSGTAVIGSAGNGRDYESSVLENMQKRRKLGTQRPMKVLRDAQNPLEVMSDNEFSRAFRFSKDTVQDIMKMLSYGLAKNTNRGQPVSPMCELLITLRFLATGSYQTKMCKNVSQPTISRILKRVTSLLSEQRLRFIKIPERTEYKRISAQFMQRGGCPEVFACIGSTHIAIKSPSRSLSDGYLNEMGFCSFRSLVNDIH